MIVSNRIVYYLFALSVLILGWLGSTYLKQHTAQLKYTADVEHTYTAIIASKAVENLVLDAEAKQRGYLLTKDPHFKTASDVSVAAIDTALATLSRITSDNSKQRVNIHLLDLAIRQRLQILAQNYQLAPLEKERVLRLNTGRLLMEKIHLYIAYIENEEKALLVERDNAKMHYQALNFTFIKYAFLFAFLLCGTAVLLIIFELRKRIKAQNLLEKSILDLQRSHEEIEQLTFTASHDLQEPLRKIRTLSTLFARKYEHTLDAEEKDIMQRIDKATEKMHHLISDLVDFTNLLGSTEKKQAVSLTEMIAGIIVELEKKSTGITWSIQSELPKITGYPLQLTLLFTQLLDNSLKYKHEERLLTIAIAYEITGNSNLSNTAAKKRERKFHKITITDNGIGFDNLFREKIFVLFQRLHTQNEYPGKGTGLALVKRIMTNHYGFISASGIKGTGATFSIYFPVE